MDGQMVVCLVGLTACLMAAWMAAHLVDYWVGSRVVWTVAMLAVNLVRDWAGCSVAD